MKRVVLRLDVFFGGLLLMIIGFFYWRVTEPSIGSSGSGGDLLRRSSPQSTSLLSEQILGSDPRYVDKDSAGTDAPLNPPPGAAEHAIFGKMSDKELVEFVLKKRGEAASNQNGSNSNNNDVVDGSTEFAKKLDLEISLLFQQMNNDTDTFLHHHSYLAARRYFLHELVRLRSSILNDSKRTPCFEYLRTEQTAGEAIYRVPCIPWDTQRLHSITLHPYGLWVKFQHVGKPTHTVEDQVDLRKTVSTSPKRAKILAPNLKIAVEMSGHMRTFRKCYKSTVENVLKANQAPLFIATYPDLGDKRFGVRVQDRDDPADITEIVSYYTPYLAGVFQADLPTITRRLTRWFPTVFQLTQWSWMIYQYMLMEIAHNMTLANANPDAWHMPHADEEMIHLISYEPPASNNSADQGMTSGSWAFDVFIRIRPDLFILGPVYIRGLNKNKAVFTLECGGEFFYDIFSQKELIRAPHHPRVEWDRDKLSDHSAVGYAKQMTKFLRLFHQAQEMTPTMQEKKIFFLGNTAERMWSQHQERNELKVIGTVGWHIMLRNAKKYRNSTTATGKTQKRQTLTHLIFGVTDAKNIGCPNPDRVMLTAAPRLRCVKNKDGKKMCTRHHNK